MKITRKKIQKIIEEETDKILFEQDEPLSGAFLNIANSIKRIQDAGDDEKKAALIQAMAAAQGNDAQGNQAIAQDIAKTLGAIAPALGLPGNMFQALGENTNQSSILQEGPGYLKKELHEYHTNLTPQERDQAKYDPLLRWILSVHTIPKKGEEEVFLNKEQMHQLMRMCQAKLVHHLGENYTYTICTPDDMNKLIQAESVKQIKK